jgi:hypothetical protein
VAVVVSGIHFFPDDFAFRLRRKCVAQIQAAPRTPASAPTRQISKGNFFILLFVVGRASRPEPKKELHLLFTERAAA